MTIQANNYMTPPADGQERSAGALASMDGFQCQVFTDSDMLALKRQAVLLAGLQRTTSGSVTLLTMRTFLTVGQHQGETVGELARHMDLPVSTVSRHLLDLGQKRRNSAPGLGLVEACSDSSDLRVRRYHLTPQGMDVLRTMIRGAEDDAPRCGADD